MSGHYIDLAVDDGELSVQFTCTHKRGASCHKQHPDPEVESFDIDDPAVEDSDECWASSWWEASGLEGLVVNCAAGVIARVPVDITYDEGIEATPITGPEPEALFAVDPAPTEAELTAGDLAVAIEVARERAELLATVRPNPDDAKPEIVDTPARDRLSIPLPIDDATIETVARGICEIRDVDGRFCVVHESYDEIADGYCTTGRWMAKNGLAALAEAVGSE